jgi:hypothetical protein
MGARGKIDQMNNIKCLPYYSNVKVTMVYELGQLAQTILLKMCGKL